MAIPPAIGFFAAGVIIGVGAQLNDTPLPIAIVIATAAAAFGIVLRHQPSPGRTSPYGISTGTQRVPTRTRLRERV